MDRSRPTQPDEHQAQAFGAAVLLVGWTRFVRALTRHAIVKLRLAGINAGRARAYEATDLVNTLILKGLEGTLGWTLRAGAAVDEILRFAYAKLRGIRWTLRRREARFVHDAPLPEEADASKGALEQLLDAGAEARAIEDAKRALKDDPEASAYLQKALDGKKRGQIRLELGWTEAEAHIVHKRMLRCIAAARMNDEDEDAPQSADA